MSDMAIKVEGLGKRYRIGANQEAYRTLREKLNETALAPFRAARHLFTRNGNGQGGHRSSVFRQPHETFWALKDVNFEVKRGEVVGIIGRNGAGKSTLLKILSRITEPTEGYADIHGRIGSLLEVGTGFHPELTGRENIYLNGSILGMKRSEINRKFDEMVAFAEIDKFIDTPVKHYSSGMYVRLAFAVAAHLDPEILLIDEVLAVGDIAFQKKCLNKVKESGHEGKTSLVVSHNMEVISRICDRAIWLNEGLLRFDGNVSHSISEYEASTRGIVEGNTSRLTRKLISDKRAWIDWIEIRNDLGEHRTVFSNGDFLNMVMAIEGDLPPASYVEWLLITDRGQVATSGGTFYKEKDLVLPTPSGLLHARIGPLPLAEGRYNLHLRLAEQPGNHMFDVWEEVAAIVISTCVPERGGLPFDIRRGVVYVPAEYSDRPIIQ